MDSHLDIELQREEGLHGVGDVMVRGAREAHARASAEYVGDWSTARRPPAFHGALVARAHHLEGEMWLHCVP